MVADLTQPQTSAGYLSSDGPCQLFCAAAAGRERRRTGRRRLQSRELVHEPSTKCLRETYKDPRKAVVWELWDFAGWCSAPGPSSCCHVRALSSHQFDLARRRQHFGKVWFLGWANVALRTRERSPRPTYTNCDDEQADPCTCSSNPRAQL